MSYPDEKNQITDVKFPNTDFVGTIKGNEKQAIAAKKVIEDAIESAKAGTLGDYAPGGILFYILEALEVTWEAKEIPPNAPSPLNINNPR